MSAKRTEHENAARAAREVEFGKRLAAGSAEDIWGWGSPAGRLRTKRRAAMIARGAGLRAGADVMEIGCGAGTFTELFAAYGPKITAVEISPDLLEIARARNLPRDQVVFVEKRFEDIEGQGRFDAVIGSSVLHHLDLDPALKTIFALLKHGGRLSFTEPNMLNPQVFIERRFRRFFPGVSPDETAFFRRALQKLLRETGFDEISVKPFDWLHPAVPETLIGVVSGIGRALEAIPGVREFSGSLWINARKP